MFLFDLPDELLELILFELPCKQILKLCFEFARFKNICDNTNLLERRKYKGFPRKNGHCVVHNIINLTFEDRKQMIRIGDVTKFFEPFDLILDLMNEHYYDLVRGDLIKTKHNHSNNNDGIYIFNGYRIMKLDMKWDKFGNLPEEFAIINNNVPSNYWYQRDDLEGLNHINQNLTVWFDSKSVKQQLIDNIDIRTINDDKELCTTFVMNNNTYILLYIESYLHHILSIEPIIDKRYLEVSIDYFKNL